MNYGEFTNTRGKITSRTWDPIKWTWEFHQEIDPEDRQVLVETNLPTSDKRQSLCEFAGG